MLTKALLETMPCPIFELNSVKAAIQSAIQIHWRIQFILSRVNAIDPTEKGAKKPI